MKKKMGRALTLSVFLFLGILNSGLAQSFDLIPLGVHGGGEESNLSAYLLGEKGENEFISLDAGTLRSGIDKAIENGLFHVSNERVLKDYIKAYFISHGHLDHLAGLVINSPDDSEKNIYALPFTINILEEHYFTEGPWENFADEGSEPRLGTYTYKRIDDQESFAIDGTGLHGQIFELSHVKPNKSSAILVTNSEDESVLYLGDTGADRIEGTDKLEKLWTAVAPLVKKKKLKAILIETSYGSSQPDDKLFGHLTPDLVNAELRILADKAGQDDLGGLKVIITHMKPGGGNIQTIKEELVSDNPLHIHFIFPIQGQKISL